MELTDTFPGSDLTLGDLTVTNTGLDNTPTDPQIISNLGALADMLTTLANDIGPFTVDSAFRSDAVNTEVGGASGSAHAMGLAADIIPTTMTYNEWYSALLNSNYIFQLGEMFVKPSQGDIHVSLPLPGKTYFAGILDPKTKQYRRFTSSELAWYKGYNADPTQPPPSSLHLSGAAAEIGQIATDAAIPLAVIAGLAAAGFFAYAIFSRGN